MCILFVYTLLKVVSYYDLRVLSMSVMGFQKMFGWGGWVGRAQSSFILDVWKKKNFALRRAPIARNLFQPPPIQPSLGKVYGTLIGLDFVNHTILIHVLQKT